MPRFSWIALVIFLLPCPAPACILCGTNPQTSPSFRQDAAQAKVILYGAIVKADLKEGGAGVSQMQVLRVLKSDPSFGDKKAVEIARFIPVQNPKAPPRFIVFCDLKGNGVDPYRGVPVKSETLVDYVKGTLALDPKDRTKELEYYFRYLDNADAEVANDAYLEFAKANDKEIGQVASKLSPDKLRRLIESPETPANRLGLYAFLLGACGGAKDATLLRSMVQNLTPRTQQALDGLLGGYIQLRPREGWDLALTLLRDEKRSFLDRWAVLRTYSFYFNWKPDAYRREVLRGLAVGVTQGDIADVAVEDLRRWKLWDLTDDVLAQYGKPSHNAPIVRRSIIRYALCCPRNEALRFVAEVRKQDPETVKEIEESLQLEKK
jgi:hypothetical protein